MEPGSPEHRLASVPKRPRSPAWNREGLKAEYMLDEFEEVVRFFEARHPEIPRATWEKWHPGDWRLERRAYVAKAAEKAVQKAIERRTRLLERHSTIGQVISKVAVEGLVDPATGAVKMTPKTAEEAARMAKIGTEIEARALEMEEGPSMPILGGEVEVDIGPDDLERIRFVARAIGRRKAFIREGGPTLLGDGERPAD